MSLATGLTIKSDGISPLVRRMIADTQPAVMGRWVGTAAKKLFQNHLLTLGTNKRGWPSTKFWSRAAKSVSFDVAGSNVRISINQQGVRQRYFGGRITARNKKALTVPISPEAADHVASDFPSAFLLKTKRGAYLVQHGTEVSTKSGKVVKRTGKGFKSTRVSAFLEFLFKLVPYVDQQANPNVLPSPAVIQKTVAQEISQNLEARFAKGGS